MARMENCLLAILITTSLLAGVAQPREFVLVTDGQPAATIVLPAETEFDRYLAEKKSALEKSVREANPGLDEKAFARLLTRSSRKLQALEKSPGDEELLAAEELQSVVEKISGAKLPIQRVGPADMPKEPAILLGAALARKAGLGKKIDELHKDGLLCTVERDSLVLSGRRARGTLYAVYELLEELGCRWVLPGPFGELYPAMKTVATRIDRIETPSHSQRYFWCTYGHAKDYPRWSLRNKGNFVIAVGDHRVHQGHALSQPLKWGANQEKYRVKQVRRVRERKKGPDGKPKVEWVEKEVWTLPDDYYAMRNGKLAFHIPNMSNPKVWELYADHYINHFNARPDEAYVSMSAEDGLVDDERPETRKLDSMEFDYFMGTYSATDRLWFFLNRVIEKVTPVHPTKKYGVLVYANNLMSPRFEKVHPNMALVFAPLGVSPLHHVRDPKSKTNREYRKWLEDWMLMAETAGAETYYYDYEPMGYCWNMALICPRWGIIGKNYPWFHELGLDGHTTQGYDDWASCGLDNYLMQRLYWDVTQDYKDVIADYAQARFGAAADVMLDYYELLEQRMYEIPDLYSNEVWDNHLILTPDVREKCRKLLTKARRSAETERAKAHVQTMVDLQESTDAMCDAIELAHETGEFGEAAKMMATCFAIRDKLNKLYPNFMNTTRLDDKRKQQYMTGGIYNQYLKFDKKIREAAASVLLPRHWKGMLDTRNHAWSLGYHKPDVSVRHLDDQDVTVCPDVKYNTQREVAAFFYRTEAKVPRSVKGKKVTILFPSIIARGLQIWINGESVEFDCGTHKDTTWRGPTTFWYDYDHQEEFDVTPHIKPGQKNTIVFRVFKCFDFGGTYRRVFLLAT